MQAKAFLVYKKIKRYFLQFTKKPFYLCIRLHLNKIDMKQKMHDDEPSDMVAGFKAMDEHRKEVNQANREEIVPRLKSICRELGISCETITPYQYRVYGPKSLTVDIYPTKKRYHFFGERAKRGSFTDIEAFIKKTFSI